MEQDSLQEFVYTILLRSNELRRTSKRKLMEEREGRKRLSMDIPNDIYEKVEKGAKKRNITITKYVLQALLQKLREEQYYEC